MSVLESPPSTKLTTRVYHSYPGAAYALPADEVERERLTSLHYGLKSTFGGILLAPVTLKDGDEVLDACTGTGVWLLDLAKDVPSGVQLHGIDISSHQFPPAPKNLSLSIHSILSLPPDWTNKFTLTHQRLLITGLRTSEWPTALSELYRVTKPSGWVQLCEFTKFWGGPVTNHWWNITKDVFGRLGFMSDCGQKLESMAREAGFEDVHTVARTYPIGKRGGEAGMMLLNSNFKVFEALKGKILDVAGDIFASGEEFDREIERFRSEIEEGEWECCYEWVVCFGRKGIRQ